MEDENKSVTKTDKICQSQGTTEAMESDRAVPTVPMPYSKKLRIEDIYKDGSAVPDYKLLVKLLFDEAILEHDLIKRIIDEAKKLLEAEPNMLSIDTPLTICGDIHGQFYDLLRLLEIGGPVESTTYLFLGDYVDRGSFSCECLILLYSLKINFPSTVFLLRGNHECRHLTDYFTFKNECTHKYDLEIYELFCDSFNVLPLAALVNKQFLCVHGGISPELTLLSDFDKINRFVEPPSTGLFCDILWSDPIDVYGNETGSDEFISNAVRGCSFNYTYKAVCAFLDRNKLLSLVRAHEAQDAGYRMYKKSKTSGFPSLITIFSAPNYLDVYNNGGAVLKYEGNVLNIKQFKCSPHPYYLPNFMNVFTWSIPFVGEKVMEILECILSNITDEESEDDEIFTSNPYDSMIDRKMSIKNKIRAVGKMSRMFGALREESESALALKGLSANGILQSGILMTDKEKLDQAVRRLSSGDEAVFDEVKQLDLINEKLPPVKKSETE